MANLRVGIDGTPLLGPRTGIGHYTANLCTAMMRTEPSLQLQFFYGFSWSDRMPEDVPEDVSEKSQNTIRRSLLRLASHVVRYSVRIFGPRVAIFRKRILAHMEKSVFRRGIKNFGLNIIHATNSYMHPSATPTIITVCDISCFRHPETHPEQRVQWQRKTLPKSLHGASHVLTISEFTKNELIDYFGISPEKITVAYMGVNRCFRPRDFAQTIRVLNKFNLPWQEYILSVGTIEPRKNLQTLIEAYTRLPARISTKFPIAIVGMRGWKESSFIKSLDPLVRKGSVRLLGYVDQDELPLLFNGARIFAYPSIYEGFGIPVAEAMATGIPVVTSNSASLPEIVGDSALLVDPLNIESWTETLHRALLDEELRVTLRTKGIERVRYFTWDQCAKKTLDVYKRTLRLVA